MSEHTPTPWFQDRVEGDTYSHISSKPGEGGDIATAWITGDVNAAFIVKAVNSHDDLVKALVKIEYALRKDSLTDNERVEGARVVALAALASIKEPA